MPPSPKVFYVIIDWHSHYARNHTGQAIAVFQQISQQYGQDENVIYEIYNALIKISWSNIYMVKPYVKTIIAASRERVADNLIIVGNLE